MLSFDGEARAPMEATPRSFVPYFQQHQSACEQEETYSRTELSLSYLSAVAETRRDQPKHIRAQKLPAKLHQILSRPEFSEIIAWMPHGKSWKVFKPHLFELLVMPVFFYNNKYHSFNRLINAWGFQRITHGRDQGAYYHKLFLRDKPQLQESMRRMKNGDKKPLVKKADEPDFYSSPSPLLPPSTVSSSKNDESDAARGRFAMINQNGLTIPLAAEPPAALPQQLPPKGYVGCFEGFEMRQMRDYVRTQGHHAECGLSAMKEPKSIQPLLEILEQSHAILEQPNASNTHEGTSASRRQPQCLPSSPQVLENVAVLDADELCLPEFSVPCWNIDESIFDDN